MLVLLACGLVEIAASVRERELGLLLLPAIAVPVGGLGALAWVAFKVGLLSYGGGFVIIPLMQSDAVHHYHWVTNGQFLNAVALGQITPGPVVLTVAVVGYAARGLGGGLLAAAIAFAPSFAFILIGGRHFHALRSNERARAFLDGAGPAAIGAILGASIPLALALGTWWQIVLLAVAGCSLFLLRRASSSRSLALGVAGSVLVGHARRLASRSATEAHDQRSTTACRAAARSSTRSAGDSSRSRRSFARRSPTSPVSNEA